MILRVALLLAFVFAAGCKRSSPPPRPRPVAKVPAAETPAGGAAAPDKAAGDEDPSWLAGTWQKQGEPRWLLFNLPGEAAELAGKPARVVRRGKLVIHGRFASVIFPDGEMEIEGSRDHAVLTATGGGVYRRGSPP